MLEGVKSQNSAKATPTLFYVSQASWHKNLQNVKSQKLKIHNCFLFHIEIKQKAPMSSTRITAELLPWSKSVPIYTMHISYILDGFTLKLHLEREGYFNY